MVCGDASSDTLPGCSTAPVTVTSNEVTVMPAAGVSWKARNIGAVLAPPPPPPKLKFAWLQPAVQIKMHSDNGRIPKPRGFRMDGPIPFPAREANRGDSTIVAVYRTFP